MNLVKFINLLHLNNYILSTISIFGLSKIILLQKLYTLIYNFNCLKNNTANELSQIY